MSISSGVISSIESKHSAHSWLRRDVEIWSICQTDTDGVMIKPLNHFIDLPAETM